MEKMVKNLEWFHNYLICPLCHAPIKLKNDFFGCQNPQCLALFPVVNGIPILLNEQSSLFCFDDFIKNKETFFSRKPRNRIKAFIQRHLPSINKNIKAYENFIQLNKLLSKQSGRNKILVIGGSVAGEGIQPLLENNSMEIVISDVSLGLHTMLICDAHDIPFQDCTFDAVIIQAVLEHVVDPYRCVEEVFRVLKARGFLYAETPFMQQVHGGKYDFTRFTHLGHRRLLRKFEEIDSGVVCGPGMALAWSFQYFLTSFTNSGFAKKTIKLFVQLTAFPLKYFDYYLIKKPGVFDSASGYFFLGIKSDKILSDRDLIKQYRGAE